MSARKELLHLLIAAGTGPVTELEHEYRGRPLDFRMNGRTLNVMVSGGTGWLTATVGYLPETLELVRNIDQLIDILDEREPTGFEDAAINPDMAHHVTLRINDSGHHAWFGPDDKPLNPGLRMVRSTYSNDYQITPGDFLALLRKANQ